MIPIDPNLYYLLSVYEFLWNFLKVILISSPLFVGAYLLFKDLIDKMSKFDKEHGTHHAIGQITCLVAISFTLGSLIVLVFGG